MKKVTYLMCALVIAPMVLVSALAEDQESQTFHNHSTSFEIPDGWEVYSDTEEGDNSSTIITDGKAAIRVSTIKLPSAELDKLARDYGQKRAGDCYQIKPDTTWEAIYEKESWYVVDAVCEYYKDWVILPATLRCCCGSDDFLTRGRYMGYSTNADVHEESPPDAKLLEWYLVWIRPEYNGTFIAVHALFPVDQLDGYGIEKLTKPGDPRAYFWPKPLYDVMVSFSTDWAGRICKKAPKGGDVLLSI